MELILVVNFFLALRVNEIPNKTDCGNISIDPRYMNIEMGTRPLSLISGNISLKFKLKCDSVKNPLYLEKI
jgi:hypothetical protein